MSVLLVMESDPEMSVDTFSGMDVRHAAPGVTKRTRYRYRYKLKDNGRFRRAVWAEWHYQYSGYYERQENSPSRGLILHRQRMYPFSDLGDLESAMKFFYQIQFIRTGRLIYGDTDRVVDSDRVVVELTHNGTEILACEEFAVRTPYALPRDGWRCYRTLINSMDRYLDDVLMETLL